MLHQDPAGTGYKRIICWIEITPTVDVVVPNRNQNSLDVCFHLQAIVPESGIHGDENGIGIQPCIVLVDQHRVHRDVRTGGVPTAEACDSHVRSM